jgi:alkanesulfonate monooxygenase SsuD/methylene tetrahydromethanopterin reductase-like flavin-dependent oxidoreductase (luciferase family)
MPATPLSVLDLTPVSSGSSVAEALHNTIDLARHAERLGYRRYWLAEHHLNPGVVGAVPELVIQAVAAATGQIRVGSGAVQTGHRTPLSVVEAFGTLDALYPGRIDLGLGRSGGPRAPREQAANGSRIVGGVVIPKPFSFAGLLGSPRELVADRVDTQFVGSAATVAGQLAALPDVTGADELLVTTITHDHADRVRSYELLAKEWVQA